MWSAGLLTTVRWLNWLRGPAPGWVGAFLVAVLAGPGEAVTLNPGDILIANGASSSGDGNVLRVSPPDDQAAVLVSGDPIFDPVAVAIAANGDLLVADQLTGVIRVNPADLSKTPVSSGGNFVVLTGIAIAATGDLFVTDLKCCGGQGGVIRVNPVDGAQTVVSPVVGKPNKFAAPTGIAVAPTGDLFVSDAGCCGGQGGVIRLNPVDGAQTVVSPVDMHPNKFVAPTGIAISTTGDLFVSDAECCEGKGGVIRVNPVDGTQTVVSPRLGQRSFFASPVAIALSPTTGEPFVADLTCCGNGNSGGVIVVDPITGGQLVVASGTNFAGPSGIAIVPPSPLPPGGCGGSVPCACGDRVVHDRTLRGVDPVTRTVCPADGLVVAAGVTLDLGGATLRGQATGAGILIEPGAAHVTVRRGTVTGFAAGVRGEGTTGVHLANLQVVDSSQDGVNLTGDGHAVEVAVIQGSGGHGVTVVGHGTRLSRLQVRSNARAGVRLVGNGHTLEQSAIAGNGGAGSEVSGDGNQVALLQVEGNGGDGILVSGLANRAARNVATRNKGNGLEIRGESAAVEGNRATGNGEAGLQIHGSGHTVRLNVAGQNTGAGLSMVGTTESRFDRNRGEHNGGFGIADDSTGTGTGGTANTYTQNTCGRGNAAGASSPVGLCR